MVSTLAVKLISILHSTNSKNSCHLYELPQLLAFFVVSFGNPNMLRKSKELEQLDLTSRQNAGEERSVPST